MITQAQSDIPSASSSSQSQSEQASPSTAADPFQPVLHKFSQIVTQSCQLMAKEQFQEAEQKLALLLQKINFMKQNRSELDTRYQLVCCYNLAGIYQKQWLLDKCSHMLQKSLKLLIPLGSASFKIDSLIIQTQLQYCAILSQRGQHHEALTVSIGAINRLIAIHEHRLSLAQQGYDDANRAKKNLQPKSTQSSNFQYSYEKVQFSAEVLKAAIKLLHQVGNIKSYEDMLNGSDHEALLDVKSKAYCWRSNPQNNVKLLARQLCKINDQNQSEVSANKLSKSAQLTTAAGSPNTSSESPSQTDANSSRTLLGLKKRGNSLDEMSISQIMLMKPMLIQQLTSEEPSVAPFLRERIIEQMIYLAVCYFSVSIETRFLQAESAKPQNQKVPDQRLALKKSEIFHLKAIELLCRYLSPQSALVNHLIVNYYKHYMDAMQVIEEETSVAEYSEIYDRRMSSSCLINLDGEDDRADATARSKGAYRVDDPKVKTIGSINHSPSGETPNPNNNSYTNLANNTGQIGINIPMKKHQSANSKQFLLSNVVYSPKNNRNYFKKATNKPEASSGTNDSRSLSHNKSKPQKGSKGSKRAHQAKV